MIMQPKKMTALWTCVLATILLLVGAKISSAFDVRLSDDAYTYANSPTSKLGTAAGLNIQEYSGTAARRTFIKFDLSNLVESGYGSGNVDRAFLKIFARKVASAGSFDVKRVTSSWDELTISHSNAPAIDSGIEATVTLDTSENNTFIYIDVTELVKN